MKTFIHTRVVQAQPMTRREYCNLRGWGVPENEDPNSDGYLVQDDSCRDYLTWCFKDIFQEYYVAAESLTFGLALELIKKGKIVRRLEWPIGMNISILIWFKDETKNEPLQTRIDKAILCGDYSLGMKNTPDTNNVELYSVSLQDMFAKDWIEVVN